MSKPRIRGSHGSDLQRISAEDDRLTQPPILDSRSQQKRILLVDDNSDVAFSLRLELESINKMMQVYSYDNPVKALVDFKPNFYDLLLVDINMPLMDGFELCNKLLEKDINIRVCFMTAGEKPISTDALVKRIRAELE